MTKEEVRTVERGGLLFSFRHEEEFEAIYKAIFQEGEYDFTTVNPEPRIIDAGAHIGVATLYFKKKYPMANIICFEPNPSTFSLLQKNIIQNNLEDVTLVSAALATDRGEVPFYIGNPKDGETPYTWGDSAARNKWLGENPNAYKTISVQAITLSEYLTKPVDLLKLDVEGSEEEVLREAGEKLRNIKQIFMEFHGSSTNPANDSGRLLELLRSNGFSFNITQEGEPIEEQEIRKDDPYWLIIYAYRDG